MTITAEQAAKLHETLPGVRTAMMDGYCLAVLLCSYFDDGEPNPDSDNGWSEQAEAGYEEVIAAIRAHYDPAIRALIASEAARKLAEERLREAKLAFENVDAQVEDEGEFTERSWEQLRAILKRSTMTDALKRLWLWPAEPEDGVDKSVSFPNQPYPSGPTEYIRADVARADAELAVAEAIRQAAEAAYEADSLELSIHGANVIAARILALTPADALAEVQRLRDAVEALVVVLDRNDKKGPIPDVEMMFCWLASQGVRAAFRKIAQKGEAT